MSSARTTHIGRRSFLLTLTAGLALAGCSTDDDAGAKKSEPAQSKKASSLMPAGEGKTSYPLTVKTSHGDATLKKRPERVVPIYSAQDAEYLAMLGVTPVSVPASISDDAWMKNAFPTRSL